MRTRRNALKTLGYKDTVGIFASERGRVLPALIVRDFSCLTATTSNARTAA